MNRYLATLAFSIIFISANCQISVITNNALNITSTSATLNGNYDPKGNATQYIFKIWETYNIGSSISIVGNLPAATGSQYVTLSIMNLKPTTQYTYTLLVNQAGIIYSGNSVNFITACGIQSLTTKAATEITSNSAILNGQALVTGRCIATYSFTLLQTTNGITYTYDYQSLSSYKVTGLMRNTTYAYRFNANISGYTYQGNTVEFTTTCESPSIVTTKTATNIESRSAILQGNYDAGGCLTNYYYQYGTTTNYELSTPITSSTNTGIQNVSFCIEHLVPNSTYHYRLVVTQQGNSYFGNDITFTTPNETSIIESFEPDINSFTATNITSTGFKAKWNAVEGAELYNVSWKVDGTTYSTAPQSTATNEIDITGLTPNTKYYFRVQTRCNGQLSSWSPSSLKGFTTLPSNQAPLVPNYVSLPFGTHLVAPQSVILSWNSSDPEGDPLHFDIYMGSSESSLTKLISLTNNSYTFSAESQGTYFWKVVAFDSYGHFTEGAINYFTVGPYAQTNYPPSAPGNPFPENKTFGTAIHPTFSWTSTDPEKESVTCEIFMGTSTDNLVKLATVPGTSSEKSFISMYNLAGQQTYYWKVVSTDNLGATSESPIWSFTTCEQNQAITFNPIPNQTYRQAELTNIASTISGLPITYSSSKNEIAKVLDGKIQIVGAGECIIYANQQGKAGYWSPAQEAYQTLTVNPMPIEVTAHAIQKIYGENDPELTYNATPNLVNNDSFTGSLSRNSGDNAGTYTILQGTLSAGNNYSITYLKADFTISKKSLNVKAESKSKNYGEANPEFSISLEGFVNNDDKSVIDALPTITCTATQNSISGTYSIELSGGSDNNYDLALENGTLQVNPILGSVNTTSTQNITSSTVDVYGDLTSHGGEENIVRGFVYGTSANPTILDSKVEVGSGEGAFSQTIYGLAPNVKYYVRSYASNSVGTVYGNELFFTTLSTGISESESSGGTIYPNPTTGIVYFRNIDSNAKIEIYNLSGALVKRAELVNNQINIKNLMAGTYIIKALYNNTTSTFKIIKE